MQRIVILGGCGYIGSKLFTELQSRRYKVDTVDLEWFGNLTNPKNIKIDYKDLPKSFFDKYDIVILLAGHSTVGMCEKDRVGSCKNNIENFVTLLKKLGKQKFIYASTYRLYSNLKTYPANETDDYNNPSTMYDLTKKTIDNYVSFSSVEFYGLRMATVNGYSPNLRANQIINKMFLSAKKDKSITLFDPRAHFSVLGIEDVCKSIQKIIAGKDRRGIYNLASFEANTKNLSKDIAKRIKNVEVIIKKTSKKSSHIRIDTTKFQQAYGFTFVDSSESIITSLVDNVSKKTHIITH